METRRIADQLRRSSKGPAWHGPAVMEILEGVDARMAAAPPRGQNHSIWELLGHITSWQLAALDSLSGTPLNVDELGNFPLSPQSAPEGSWEAGQHGFQETCESLANAIESMPDSKLDDIVPGREYNFYFLLHGVAQHNLYHAGQMMQLRRYLENTQE